MNYGIVFERIREDGFPEGFWYAHVPSLGLTTHGEGIEGAIKAARDLAELWIAEKKANHESIPQSGEFFFSTLELNADAV